MNTTSKRRERARSKAKPAISRGENGNGGRPKRTRDGAAKKQALIRAALGLFASKGYEVTTTREIAASAGCAEGLIHRYFKGKAGLLAAMIEHRARKEDVNSSDQVRPASNLTEEFLQLVDQEVERMWESRDFLRVFIPRAMIDPSLGSLMHDAFSSERAKAVLERLMHHESCLELPQSALDGLAQAVETLGLVFGFVRPVLLGHDRLGAKKMAAAVARILVDGPAVSVLV